jgi:hypothetical protein
VGIVGIREKSEMRTEFQYDIIEGREGREGREVAVREILTLKIVVNK